jgi:hypothetical protein
MWLGTYDTCKFETWKWWNESFCLFSSFILCGLLSFAWHFFHWSFTFFLCVLCVINEALDFKLELVVVLSFLCYMSCFFIFIFFLFALMFEGCESRWWNLKLGTWKEKVQAAKPVLTKCHIIIHYVVGYNVCSVREKL